MVDEVIVKGPEYSLKNPHPGYGKDPNIANELGHTHYPKYVTLKDKSKIVVNNEQEEAEADVAEEEVITPPVKSKPKGWK